MGMYDDFKCEYPLPQYPFFNPADMQTKDLECDFKKYTLKPDGKLWVHVLQLFCQYHLTT